MSDKLQKQISVELEQLNQLLSSYLPLLNAISDKEPSYFEQAALATMLHGFYTGVENVFKRVVVECGDELPEGAFWHRDLLDLMTQATENRQAVISQSLCQYGRLYFTAIYKK